MADNPIQVTCENEFDPPVLRVIVAGFPIGDYPRNDYDRFAAALGLPPSQEVCDEYNG